MFLFYTKSLRSGRVLHLWHTEIWTSHISKAHSHNMARGYQAGTV